MQDEATSALAGGSGAVVVRNVSLFEGGVFRMLGRRQGNCCQRRPLDEHHHYQSCGAEQSDVLRRYICEGAGILHLTAGQTMASPLMLKHVIVSLINALTAHRTLKVLVRAIAVRVVSNVALQ